MLKRLSTTASLVILARLCGTAAAAATPADCVSLKRHGHATDASACYRSLTQSNDPYLRAEGDWGLELYQDANNEFRNAVARDDKNALYRVRWGRLMHERFTDSTAVDLFNEALKRDPANAGAYLGLALVAAEDFDSGATGLAEKALERDSKLVEARELLANIALEDSDIPRVIKETDAALAIDPDAIDAMAIRAAAELLSDRTPDMWLQKALQVNPGYGDAYARVGFHLVLNRRYDEGVSYYRKAIALDARDWPAMSELGINLMRLGQEDEPRRLLEICYNNGYRDAATVNSLRLLDTYKNFDVFKDATSTLKLDHKEAELLHPYVDAVLKRAIATYQKKYAMTLPGPVQVEVYPNHDDFAVRTEGLPGLGALGVTFGTVIAMDSPSGRKPGSFNWASTLWHEMDHVFVLTATNHRVPRWFAEGLAVHEEGQANPAWAYALTPDVVVAMKDKKLLPVADLDRGFVRPEYPEQVIVSYYQAGRICDYIQNRWGADKLVEMVHAFAKPDPTPDVIEHVLGIAPDAFDRQFQAWLYQDVGPIVDQFDTWRETMTKLLDLYKDGQFDAALEQGEKARRLYPQFVGDANPYELVADIRARKGDEAGARAVLSDYRKFGGENPPALKKLAALQEEMGQIDEAADTLEAINEIYPVGDNDLHARLGGLRMKQRNFPAAIREYTAVVALHPLDKAGALFDLAQGYFAARQLDEAEKNVLGALEAAPGYRPAQQLLLQIEDASPQPSR